MRPLLLSKDSLIVLDGIEFLEEVRQYPVGILVLRTGCPVEVCSGRLGCLSRLHMSRNLGQARFSLFSARRFLQMALRGVFLSCFDMECPSFVLVKISVLCSSSVIVHYLVSCSLFSKATARGLGAASVQSVQFVKASEAAVFQPYPRELTSGFSVYRIRPLIDGTQ